VLIVFILPAIIFAKFFVYYFIMRSVYPGQRPKAFLYALCLTPLFFCAYIAHSYVLLFAYGQLAFQSFTEVSLPVYIGAVLLSVFLISFFEIAFLAIFWSIRKMWPRLLMNIALNAAIVAFFAVGSQGLFDYFVLGGTALGVGLPSPLLSLIKR